MGRLVYGMRQSTDGFIADARGNALKAAHDGDIEVSGTRLRGIPAALTEVRRLGRTLKQRAADVLAFFDRPGISDGPTEAVNGRLEHLRGFALGFRNLTHKV